MKRIFIYLFIFHTHFEALISSLSLFTYGVSLLTLKKMKKMSGVLWCVSLLQTDTASVLLEAIGYIRFLQGQIEVMYLLHIILSAIMSVRACS